MATHWDKGVLLWGSYSRVILFLGFATKCNELNTIWLQIRGGQLPGQGPVYDHPMQKNNCRVHSHSEILRYTQARREQYLMRDIKKVRNSGKLIP